MVILPADDDRPATEPALRVVRGDATPEEIAALVTVLLSGPAGVEPAHPSHHLARRSRSAWSDRSRQLRAPLHPGPGSWRRSGWPG